MQATNFGGTFDQLFLLIFLCNFHRRCLSTSSIPWCKKVKNDRKLKSRGSCLKSPSSKRDGSFVIFRHDLSKRHGTIAGNFRQRKISSKATVRLFVRDLFSTNVDHRLFATLSRLFAYLFIDEYFWSPTYDCVKKFSQEFNLLKKLAMRKATNLNSWRKFPAIQ